MKDASPIKQLIDCWPTREALALEIGAKADVVHKWANSGRIPSGWQAAVTHAAQARGLEYATAEWMLQVHARCPISSGPTRPPSGAAA
jgi:hypothetical protein